jgi:hypothetical protein
MPRGRQKGVKNPRRTREQILRDEAAKGDDISARELELLLKEKSARIADRELRFTQRLHTRSRLDGDYKGIHDESAEETLRTKAAAGDEEAIQEMQVLMAEREQAIQNAKARRAVKLKERQAKLVAVTPAPTAKDPLPGIDLNSIPKLFRLKVGQVLHDLRIQLKSSKLQSNQHVHRHGRPTMDMDTMDASSAFPWPNGPTYTWPNPNLQRESCPNVDATVSVSSSSSQTQTQTHRLNPLPHNSNSIPDPADYFLSHFCRITVHMPDRTMPHLLLQRHHNHNIDNNIDNNNDNNSNSNNHRMPCKWHGWDNQCVVAGSLLSQGGPRPVFHLDGGIEYIFSPKYICTKRRDESQDYFTEKKFLYQNNEFEHKDEKSCLQFNFHGHCKEVLDLLGPQICQTSFNCVTTHQRAVGPEMVQYFHHQQQTRVPHQVNKGQTKKKPLDWIRNDVATTQKELFMKLKGDALSAVTNPMFMNTAGGPETCQTLAEQIEALQLRDVIPFAFPCRAFFLNLLRSPEGLEIKQQLEDSQQQAEEMTDEQVEIHKPLKRKRVVVPKSKFGSIRPAHPSAAAASQTVNPAAHSSQQQQSPSRSSTSSPASAMVVEAMQREWQRGDGDDGHVIGSEVGASPTPNPAAVPARASKRRRLPLTRDINSNSVRDDEKADTQNISHEQERATAISSATAATMATNLQLSSSKAGLQSLQEAFVERPRQWDDITKTNSNSTAVQVQVAHTNQSSLQAPPTEPATAAVAVEQLGDSVSKSALMAVQTAIQEKRLQLTLARISASPTLNTPRQRNASRKATVKNAPQSTPAPAASATTAAAPTVSAPAPADPSTITRTSTITSTKSSTEHVSITKNTNPVKQAVRCHRCGHSKTGPHHDGGCSVTSEGYCTVPTQDRLLHGSVPPGYEANDQRPKMCPKAVKRSWNCRKHELGLPLFEPQFPGWSGAPDADESDATAVEANMDDKSKADDDADKSKGPRAGVGSDGYDSGKMVVAPTPSPRPTPARYIEGTSTGTRSLRCHRCGHARLGSDHFANTATNSKDYCMVPPEDRFPHWIVPPGYDAGDTRPKVSHYAMKVNWNRRKIDLGLPLWEPLFPGWSPANCGKGAPPTTITTTTAATPTAAQGDGGDASNAEDEGEREIEREQVRGRDSGDMDRIIINSKEEAIMKARHQSALMAVQAATVVAAAPLLSSLPPPALLSDKVKDKDKKKAYNRCLRCGYAKVGPHHPANRATASKEYCMVSSQDRLPHWIVPPGYEEGDTQSRKLSHSSIRRNWNRRKLELGLPFFEPQFPTWVPTPGFGATVSGTVSTINANTLDAATEGNEKVDKEESEDSTQTFIAAPLPPPKATPTSCAIDTSFPSRSELVAAQAVINERLQKAVASAAASGSIARMRCRRCGHAKTGGHHSDGNAAPTSSTNYCTVPVKYRLKHWIVPPGYELGDLRPPIGDSRSVKRAWIRRRRELGLSLWEPQFPGWSPNKER